MTTRKPRRGQRASTAHGEGTISYADGDRVDVILDNGREVTVAAEDVTIRD